jgi:hypothetical protein
MNASEQVAFYVILTNMIRKGDIKTDNVVNLMKDVLNLINKYDKYRTPDCLQTTIAIFREIAKGPDGLLGTSDDIIPASTLVDLQQMIELSVFDDLFIMMNDLVKHRKCDLSRAMMCCLKMS